MGGAHCTHYGGVVAVVLVTGMSGTGKSAALAELARRGHRVVDTDYGEYSEEVRCSDAGGREQLWREDRIEALLDGDDDGLLFISGCVSNQGTFYPRFDAVVLLTAPASPYAAASAITAARVMSYHEPDHKIAGL